MRALLFGLVAALLVATVVAIDVSGPHGKKFHAHKIRMQQQKDVAVSESQKKERLGTETALVKTAKSERPKPQYDVSAEQKAAAAVAPEIEAFRKLVATAKGSSDVNYLTLGRSNGKPLLTYSFKAQPNKKGGRKCPAEASTTGFECAVVEETFTVKPSVVKVGHLIEDRRIGKDAEIGACLTTGNLQAGRGDYIMTTFHGDALQGDDLFYPPGAGAVGWISMIAQGQHQNSQDWDLGYLSSDYCECFSVNGITSGLAKFANTGNFYAWLMSDKAPNEIVIAIWSEKQNKLTKGSIDKRQALANCEWDTGKKFELQFRAFFPSNNAPVKGDSGAAVVVTIDGKDYQIGIYSSSGRSDFQNWDFVFFTPIWDIQLPNHINYC